MTDLPSSGRFWIDPTPAGLMIERVARNLM